MSSVGDPVTFAPVDARPRTSSRLELLDGLRGYLLVAMFTAHFAIEMDEIGLFTWLSYLRHSRRLPVGDIEFFLPISGFVVALSYHGIAARWGQRGLWRTVGRRWRWIYTYQVLVTVLLVLVTAAGFPGVDLRVPGDMSTLRQVGLAFTLAVLPQYADILVLNLALLPLVPPAFALLARGRAWLLGALLLLAWTVARTGIDQQLSAGIVSAGFEWHRWFGLMGNFNPLSYALLFFAGFYLGYRFKTDPGLFRTGAWRPQGAVALVALGILLMYLVGNSFSAWRAFAPTSNVLLSPHAVVVTATVFYILFWLLAAPGLPRAASAVSGMVRAFLTWRPLVFLGSNSLFVYACHVIAVALAKAAILVIITAGHRPGQFLMLAIAVAGLAIVYAATSLKTRFLPWAA